MQKHETRYNVQEMMKGGGSESVGGLFHESSLAAGILGTGILSAIAYSQTIYSADTVPPDSREGLVILGAAGIGVLSTKIANPIRRISDGLNRQ